MLFLARGHFVLVFSAMHRFAVACLHMLVSMLEYDVIIITIIMKF